MSAPRLVTIPISHYCEKARWALERAGIEYREERHIQGIHMLMAKRAGGGITVPVLVTPERSIGESEDILHWVDERTAARAPAVPSPRPATRRGAGDQQAAGRRAGPQGTPPHLRPHAAQRASC